MEKKGHIVFDCDGTLVDSVDVSLLSFQKLAEEFNNKKIAMSEIKQKYTPHVSELFLAFNMDWSIPDLKDKLMLRWSEIANESKIYYPLFDGVLEMLETLSKDFYLYIWTGRDRRSLQVVLKNTGIEHFFKDIQTADDSLSKPSPEGILKLVGDADKKSVIVIGDSHVDILGARNFNVSSIAVHWCPNIPKNLLISSGATYHAYNVSECMQFIKEHFNIDN